MIRRGIGRALLADSDSVRIFGAPIVVERKAGKGFAVAFKAPDRDDRDGELPAQKLGDFADKERDLAVDSGAHRADSAD